MRYEHFSEWSNIAGTAPKGGYMQSIVLRYMVFCLLFVTVYGKEASVQTVGLRTLTSAKRGTFFDMAKAVEISSELALQLLTNHYVFACALPDKVACSTCNGAGGSGKTICPICNGKRPEPGSGPCKDCKNMPGKCRVCLGEGMITRTDRVKDPSSGGKGKRVEYYNVENRVDCSYCNKTTICPKCGGRPPATPASCARCNGLGFLSATPCNNCRGTGGKSTNISFHIVDDGINCDKVGKDKPDKIDAASNKKYQSLRLSDGLVLSNAVVKTIEGNMVKIFHSKGMGTFPFAKLDPVIRQELSGNNEPKLIPKIDTSWTLEGIIDLDEMRNQRCNLLSYAMTKGYYKAFDLAVKGIPRSDFQILVAKENLLHAVVKRGQAEFVRTLLDAGVNLNQQNDSGQTALHVACENNYTNIIDILVQKGADIKLADFQGKIPVDPRGDAKPAVTDK